MPRNGSGTCSPPGGTTAVPGQIIESAPYNNAIADLYSILTDSLSRTGQGGMQSDLDMGGNQITAVGAPIAPTDAANKAYVDAAVSSAGQFVGDTSTGTANAQAVAILRPDGFAQEIGDTVTFPWGFTNTALLTLNVETIGAADVRKIGPSGPVPTTGGEAVAGNLGVASWDGTYWVLQNPANSFGSVYTNLASAATTDLGTVPSRSVNITGTTTITSFGSAASTDFPLYFVNFAGALTLTYDGTALIIPGAETITTVAGDSAVLRYLGSGNWRVIHYQRAGATGSVNPVPMIGLTWPTRLVVLVTSDSLVDIDATQVTLTNGSLIYAANNVNLTVNIATSGANGLDTGAEAASTPYYTYVIYNPATVTVAGLLSASATSPTLPSGYTYYRRVGAVLNNSSSNLYRTRQVGPDAQYIIGTNPTGMRAMISGVQSRWTAVAVSSSPSYYIPPTASAITVVLSSNATSSGEYSVAAPNNSYADSESTTNPPPLTSGNSSGLNTFDSRTATFILEGGNVYYGSNRANSALRCLGWVDSF